MFVRQRGTGRPKSYTGSPLTLEQEQGAFLSIQHKLLQGRGPWPAVDGAMITISCFGSTGETKDNSQERRRGDVRKFA